jgi:hypothetical protein
LVVVLDGSATARTAVMAAARGQVEYPSTGLTGISDIVLWRNGHKREWLSPEE